MPGDLAGRALAARARELQPGLKVLFASGLAKPYRKKELARKIEEVLGTAS
jgi:hypothetical protein